jgi:hypothetical protein
MKLLIIQFCSLLLPLTPTHHPKHPPPLSPYALPPRVTDTSSYSHQRQAKSVCCLPEYFVISNSAVKHNLKYSSQCLSLLKTRICDIILSTTPCTPVYWNRRFAATCSCHLHSSISVCFPTGCVCVTWVHMCVICKQV